MRRTVAAFLAVGLLAAGTAPVRADAVYHTERLTLNAVSGASGTDRVAHVDPNGPNRFAIENYQLRHADPDVTYQVWLNLYIGSANCSGTPAASLPTAQIRTNGIGNGTGQLVLTPEDVAGRGGMTFPINWTVTSAGTTTHETRCTTVTLDECVPAVATAARCPIQPPTGRRGQTMSGSIARTDSTQRR